MLGVPAFKGSFKQLSINNNNKKEQSKLKSTNYYLL